MRLSFCSVPPAVDLMAVSTLVYEVLATSLLAYGCIRNMKAVGTLRDQKDSLIFFMLKEGESLIPLRLANDIPDCLATGLLYSGYAQLDSLGVKIVP